MFLGRNPSRMSKHHNVSCWFDSNLCRSKAEPPDNKNGCLSVLCRPFCLQPRYYGLPSLLKFDGPTSPGANYEKYDFSENRKVQNPPGWWVFLLTASHSQHLALILIIAQISYHGRGSMRIPTIVCSNVPLSVTQ